MPRQRAAWAALTLVTLALSATPLPAARPNIVLIMADDMGFSDIGCYGGEIATPRLDQLAADGLRFSQFYNNGRCCPTRASLLTGLYPHQAGVGHMVGGSRPAGPYQGNLNQSCLTIAEALQPAGYRTYMVGKWHVTRHVAPDDEQDTWPRQRGFDRFYGTLTGAGSFYDPTTLCRDNTFITPENDPDYQTDRFYYTDAISDNAVTLLKDHRQDYPEQPFFLYVSYTAAHWPMHALPDDIARYRGRFDAGYDQLRRQRYDRLLQLGLIDEQFRLSATADNWQNVQHRQWELRCMEVYAAMVDRMDQGIGHIVDTLRDTEQFDNTLLLYLQDNGGCAEAMGRSSNAENIANADDYEPFGPDDLQPQIWPPMQTRDGRPVRTGPEVMPGPEDSYVAYGRAWANVSNTPFREYKHWVHEGGISTPLIAHWPAGIPTRRQGTIEAAPTHLVDLMATAVHVAQAEYPLSRHGQSLHPLEGTSLERLLVGESWSRAAPLFWEHEGNRAVRDGRWKLVAKGSAGPWELYDMQADRTEQFDLIEKYPKEARTLIAQWEQWADRTGVLPWVWDPPYARQSGSAESTDAPPR